MTARPVAADLMTADDMRVIAYHEAGHAVVAWSLGVALKEVRIDPSGGFCKHGLTMGPMFEREFMTKGDWTKVESNALVLLAGEVAEQVGNSMAQLAGDGELAELCRYAHQASVESIVPGSDREELREFVQLIFGDQQGDANEWVARAMTKASSIVTSNWTRICALSDVLVANRTLGGAEAVRIIESVE